MTTRRFWSVRTAPGRATLPMPSRSLRKRWRPRCKPYLSIAGDSLRSVIEARRAAARPTWAWPSSSTIRTPTRAVLDMVWSCARFSAMASKSYESSAWCYGTMDRATGLTGGQSMARLVGKPAPGPGPGRGAECAGSSTSRWRRAVSPGSALSVGYAYVSDRAGSGTRVAGSGRWRAAASRRQQRRQRAPRDPTQVRGRLEANRRASRNCRPRDDRRSP